MFQSKCFYFYFLLTFNFGTSQRSILDDMALWNQHHNFKRFKETLKAVKDAQKYYIMTNMQRRIYFILSQKYKC